MRGGSANILNMYNGGNGRFKVGGGERGQVIKIKFLIIRTR